MTPDLHWRLEPELEPEGNLERGFRAELADPLWLLGRQWQMGEHQGENASTPVEVRVKLRQVPIAPPADRAGQDPATAPAEAIVEGGPDDDWTIGRRVAVGLEAVARGVVPPVGADTGSGLVMGPLPAPYSALAGRVYDGRALAERFPAAMAALVPASSARGSHWRPGTLDHETRFPCGDGDLVVRRHEGGEVDWWSVDADGSIETGSAEDASTALIPNRFRYPGAPLARFWQIEDGAVDIGGTPPDRSHFPTLLLIDLIASHGDDWFTFPVPTRPGVLLSLAEATVIDSFGDAWPGAGSSWPPLAPDSWSLFRLRRAPSGAGLERALPIFLSATAALSGPPDEEVVLGLDEDSNLLWAVEQRVAGTETVQPPPRTKVEFQSGAPYIYRPNDSVPHHWHPYEIRPVEGEPGAPELRRLVQGRLGELRTDGPTALRSAPSARMLTPGAGLHAIDPAVIPPAGLRLEQRFALARDVEGGPVLWVQRQRFPLMGGPSHTLRYDLALRRRDAPPAAGEGELPRPADLPAASADDPLVAWAEPAPQAAPAAEAPTRGPTADLMPNPQYYAGGLPTFAPDADVADGRIALAQALLNAAGADPPLLADGRFGGATSAAVSAFRTLHGLPPDDSIDPDCWARLLPLALSATLHPGDPAPEGPPLARAQQALNRAGAAPPLEISARLDEATSGAIGAFQADLALPVTGGLDPETWLALAERGAEPAPEILLRLTFEYDAAWPGQGQPLAQLVRAEVLDQEPPAMIGGPAFKDGSGFRVELWDAGGALLYQAQTPYLIPLRVETFGGALRAHRRAEVRGNFTLVIPHLPNSATLALWGPSPDPDSAGDPAHVIFTFDLTTL